MSDELLRWRAEFPALEKSVYLVSHSLGAMPRRAYDHLRSFADLWVQEGINAWHDWLPEVDRAAERIGAIIGAPRGSMVMATNVSQIQTYALPADQQAQALADTLKPHDVTDANPSWTWAAGGAISTVPDLATYVQALVGGRLLNAATQKLRIDSIRPTDSAHPQAGGYGIGIAQCP
jgi:hypothetical protein